MNVARRGVAGRFIRKVTEEEQIALTEVARVLGVSERTVRAYQQQDTALSPQHGEALLKYRRLLARGSEVFGSVEAFKQWLRKPAYGFDGECPSVLLVTSEGINLVGDEVERIANGEFA